VPAPAFRAFTESGPKRKGLPTWLMAILFAVGLVVILAGLYWLLGSSKNSAAALSKPSANAENAAATPGGPVHPLQKYIEISGIRFEEDPKNKKLISVTFVVTNHALTDVYGLAGNVTLWSNTRRSDDDAQGNFSFTTDLKANQSKEMTLKFNTTKQLVELADWQYLSTDLQITAPPFSGGSLLQK
jgi:hypothetical protein